MIWTKQIELFQRSQNFPPSSTLTPGLLTLFGHFLGGQNFPRLISPVQYVMPIWLIYRRKTDLVAHSIAKCAIGSICVAVTLSPGRSIFDVFADVWILYALVSILYMWQICRGGSRGVYYRTFLPLLVSGGRLWCVGYIPIWVILRKYPVIYLRFLDIMSVVTS